ncbi:unnamed protein product [Orchesella dallaii]|uniref:Odorant receptor n=1 Tax=Orchesella dallaii TaxID=48710 RepID=A0ABP1PIS7_9HEXA
MLLKENLIHYIKLQLKLHSLIGTRPFQFSATDKLFASSKREYNWGLIKVALYSFYVLTEWMLVIHKASNGAFDKFSEGLLFATGQASYCFTKYTVFTQRFSVIELFNLLINFEEVNFAAIKISKNNTTTIVKQTQQAVILYATITGFCYLMMMWIFPCHLVPLAYFTMPECLNPSYHGDWSTSSRFQLMIIGIIVLGLYIDTGGDLALFLVNFTLVQSYCFYRYVQIVDQLVSDKPKQAQKHLPLYRQIQILNRYYNVIQKNGLIIAHEYTLIIAIIISVVTLLSLGSNVSLPEFIMHGLSGVDAAIVLVVCNTIMGQMYSASKQFCTKKKDHILSNQVGNVQRRWIQRYLKSCAVLKCNVGDVNFIEELTPLVMLDFCINQTVSLLLLQA